MGNKESTKTKKVTEVFELSDETIELLAHSTNLAKPVIIDWHKQFLLDCPDGRLSHDGFVKTYNSLNPGSKGSKFSSYVFQAFDRDKSGYIEFSEFLTSLFFLSDSGSLDERLRFVFKIIDLDSNGLIDRKELKQVLEALFDLRGVPESDRIGVNSPESRANEILTKLDRDKNNFITEQEFVAGCLDDIKIRGVLMPTRL